MTWQPDRSTYIQIGIGPSADALEEPILVGKPVTPVRLNTVACRSGLLTEEQPDSSG
jgi:hypothetical protein